MNIPNDLKYTKNDEWVKFDGPISVTVGITDFAQEQLSDIVYVDIIISIGDEIQKNDQIATIESVKAAADVYAPISGKISAINESLPDQPEILNSDPYKDGWIIKMDMSEPSEMNQLMDSSAYEIKIKDQE